MVADPRGVGVMVQVFDKSSGVYQRQFGSPGNGQSELLFPHGLALDSRVVVVAEKGNHRLQVRTNSRATSFRHRDDLVLYTFLTPESGSQVYSPPVWGAPSPLRPPSRRSARRTAPRQPSPSPGAVR
jgi:hypothetical protein